MIPIFVRAIDGEEYVPLKEVRALLAKIDSQKEIIRDGLSCCCSGCTRHNIQYQKEHISRKKWSLEEIQIAWAKCKKDAHSLTKPLPYNNTYNNFLLELDKL